MLERFLDDLHAAAKTNPAFQRLAIISRILLALAFVPTGLVKVLGERFTILGMESPVGLFFEAMYRSGAYWNFLGWSQVVAGVLLLIPRTTTLGAVMFFPIVLNIFVITLSIPFKGTWVITSGMLLASVFLLCWDYDRLKTILWPPATPPTASRVPIGRLEWTGYIIGTVAGLGVLGWTRGFVPRYAVRGLLLLGLFAVLLVLIAWVRAVLAMRTARQPG